MVFVVYGKWYVWCVWCVWYVCGVWCGMCTARGVWYGWCVVFVVCAKWYVWWCVWYVMYDAVCSQDSPNRPTRGLTLNGPFREVGGVGSENIITMVFYYLNKPIAIGDWSICIERFYCIQNQY